MRTLAAVLLALAACGPSHPTPANPVHLVPDPEPKRGPMGADTDGDGLSDDVDACPADSEDRDGVEDTDGCPDNDEMELDRDGDGVVDGRDRCPDDPEEKDGFEDEDGCPP